MPAIYCLRRYLFKFHLISTTAVCLQCQQQQQYFYAMHRYLPVLGSECNSIYTCVHSFSYLQPKSDKCVGVNIKSGFKITHTPGRTYENMSRLVERVVYEGENES